MVLGGRGSGGIGSLYRRKSPVEEQHSVITGPLRALELAFREAEARKAETYRRGILPARPTVIEHGPLRFLVSATPSADSLDSYADTLTRHNVKHVVRVCEPTYDADSLRDRGFNVHELPFPDGDAPPQHVVSQWLSLLDKVFKLNVHVARAARAPSSGSDVSSDSDSVASPASSMDKMTETVAVHCVAGLGRAPVLAAVALVEFGLDPYEAVGWIRALRRGAINARQLAYLESYSRRPPPPPVKPGRARSRSGSFVGSLWPSLKGARPFRPRSPQHSRDGSAQSSPAKARRSSASVRSPPRIAET